MSKTLKKIGYLVATFALTAVIYWLVFVDSGSKQDLLEYSLNLLGKKLMAMMPDTSNAQSVAALYSDFMDRAKNKEIPPERVEFVAANILNLSKLNTVISPQEAELVIRWSLADPVELKAVAPNTSSPLVLVSAPSRPKELHPDKWRIIGERIRLANQFSDEYRKAMKAYRKAGIAPQFQYHFQFKDGLRIAVDSTMKQHLDQRKFRDIQKHLSELERQRLIVWQKDLNHKIMREMEQHQKEFESLRQLIQLQTLEQLKALEAARTLDSLKELNSLRSLESLEALRSLEALKKLKALSNAFIEFDSIKWNIYKFFVDSLSDSTLQ